MASNGTDFFLELVRRSDLQPADPQVTVSGLEKPLAMLIAEIAQAMVRELGLEKPDSVVTQLGLRWQKGRLTIHPADPTLQVKEVPSEAFFHKIVMVRNNLRVLEQKINAHPKLTDVEKVDMQQYVTRCYGSLTTFNVLFRDKSAQFIGQKGDE